MNTTDMIPELSKRRQKFRTRVEKLRERHAKRKEIAEALGKCAALTGCFGTTLPAVIPQAMLPNIQRRKPSWRIVWPLENGLMMPGNIELGHLVGAQTFFSTRTGCLRAIWCIAQVACDPAIREGSSWWYMTKAAAPYASVLPEWLTRWLIRG